MNAFEYLQSRSGQRAFDTFTVTDETGAVQELTIRRMTAEERIDAGSRFDEQYKDDPKELRIRRMALYVIMSLWDKDQGKLSCPDNEASITVIRQLPPPELDVIDQRIMALNFKKSDELAKNSGAPKTDDS